MAKKGSKKKVKTGQLERFVDLQNKAVREWGTYSKNAATLIAQGTMSPNKWMKQYTDLSKNVAHNFGELMRIISRSR